MKVVMVIRMVVVIILDCCSGAENTLHEYDYPMKQTHSSILQRDTSQEMVANITNAAERFSEPTV